MSGRATAVACSNIALAKYWGKSPLGDNRTAVPSLSLTLAELRTTTHVIFDAGFEHDRLTIGDVEQSGRALERVVRLLDTIRAFAGTTARAVVSSNNDFPTASGLASSASGFAALAFAASGALGLSLSSVELSALARRASASAARSIFPGFVELLAGADAATPVAPVDHLDVRMVIAATTLGEKATSSTDGMLHTQATSPFYAAWLEHAPSRFEEAKRALLRGDLEALGAAMEQSTLMMHASMLAARPALVYFRDATWRVLERVRELRACGVAAFYTMDAGPHVKVLTGTNDAARVARELSAVPGVERVIVSAPGAGAELVGDG